MASVSNIFIDQDATFTTTVTVFDANGTALDLTNYTAAATLRKSHSSSSATSFTTAFNSDRTDGQITISLTDTQTGVLETGRYVYDILITSPSSVKTRVVEGQVTINPSVTR